MVGPSAGADAAEPIASPPQHSRFPLLDGARAVAALTVLIFHAGFNSGVSYSSAGGRLLAHLNVGVAVFFVISGFLLYRPFIAHRNGGPRPPRVGLYARRRALRILPAYWLILTALILIPGVTGVVGRDWLAQYLLLDYFPIGWQRGCSATPFTCGLGQTWSLGVEVTFYAALPLYVVLAGRLGRTVSRRGWVPIELGLLGLIAAASVLARFTVPFTSRAVQTSALGFAFWFALGMGLAVMSVSGVRLPFSGVWAWIVAATLYGCLSWGLPPTPLVSSNGSKLIEHVGFGLVALLIIMPAVLPGTRAGVVHATLGNAVLSWLGLISYGIFLWHYSIVLRLTGAGWTFVPVLLTTMVLTTLLAALSYYAIERTALRLRR